MYKILVLHSCNGMHIIIIYNYVRMYVYVCSYVQNNHLNYCYDDSDSHLYSTFPTMKIHTTQMSDVILMSQLDISYHDDINCYVLVCRTLSDRTITNIIVYVVT